MTTMTQKGTSNTVFFETNLSLPGVKHPAYEVFDVPRIDPDEKAFWLEHLLGDYKDKQGKNALKTPDGKFCCLGVYCDAKEMPNEIKPGVYTFPETGDRESVQMTYFSTGQHSNSSIIPFDHAIPWADKDHDTGCFSYGPGFTGDEDLFIAKGQGDNRSDASGVFPRGERWSLPKLNDSGFTFTQIADIINYFL